MFVRIFGISMLVTAAALVAAGFYGGASAIASAAILGVLEVSLSFDNAVINATVLRRMSAFWQRMFLTVGILVAVFGMRLVFPLAIVWASAGLDPVSAMRLALEPPSDGAAYFPDGRPSYETLLTDAHPQIAAFGGMFLLLLFLHFVFTRREITWLTWIERPLSKLGGVTGLPLVIAAALLAVAGLVLADPDDTVGVLVAGALGIVVFQLVNTLSSVFLARGSTSAVVATGKAGFVLFCYLEVLDASFSFDGVVGAFAITADPIIIALGLGCIGAMFVRSLTIYLVRKGTLANYVYLEHGAHWAIGALAMVLLLTVSFDIDSLITGLIGVTFIAAAFVSSIVRGPGTDTVP
ncbi:MAG: DUF475 domain-containing protein [Tomitella sp.]|nr:DUF475 domain-containing protein [Tomitella sp.]